MKTESPPLSYLRIISVECFIFLYLHGVELNTEIEWLVEL